MGTDMTVYARGTIGFWGVFFATFFAVGIVGFALIAVLFENAPGLTGNTFRDPILVYDSRLENCATARFQQTVVRWNIEEGTLSQPEESYELVATIPDPEDSGSVFLIFQQATCRGR